MKYRADLAEAREPETADRFLETLGATIRRARERNGLTRRVLADRAGLSERFLAHVEHGEGNLSILRLKHLAEALDVAMEDLIPGGAASRPEPEVRRWPFSPAVIADLFRRAGSREQERVLTVLVRGSDEERNA